MGTAGSHTLPKEDTSLFRGFFLPRLFQIMWKLVLRNAEVFVAVLALAVIIIMNSFAVAIWSELANWQLKDVAIINITAACVLLVILFKMVYVVFKGF
jgi:hypothetical protein